MNLSDLKMSLNKFHLTKTTENKKCLNPFKIRIQAFSEIYRNLTMETAGVEPASKHIAT